MNLLTHIAKSTSEHQLHLRVNILYVVLYHELALLAQVVYLAQLLQEQRQFVVAYQSYTVQHRDVSHRAHHVILSQIEVHLAVLTHSETLYLFVYLKSF